MYSILPGYVQVRGRTPAGTVYRHPNAPWRLVLHTVEGDPSTKAAMESVAANHSNGPQLWVSPRLQHRIQTVPLDKAGRALSRPSGTIDTNHMKAVQVEIFGFAGQTHDWPQDWNDWLGEHVVAPVQRAIDGSLDLNYVEPTYRAGQGIVLASRYSPIRHDAATWTRCNWVTTHQRIINNDHWDCGGLNMGRILQTARETLHYPGPIHPAPPTNSEEISVTTAQNIKEHMNLVGNEVKAKIDLLGLGTVSTVMNNQKTGIIYRVEGTQSPWWGLAGGRLFGPLNFDDAVEFKDHHEIRENSIVVSRKWHERYLQLGVVEVSEQSVEEIASAVSNTDAQFINGLAEATAQKVAEQVVALLGTNATKDVLTKVAEAISVAADAID